MRPIYDVYRTYQQNLEEGPFFDGEIPRRRLPPRHEWFDFLGTPVASRIGVPAGPLLGSRWVSLAANLGFDTLVYKTVRSHTYPSHPLPNILYLEEDLATMRPTPPADLDKMAITNSYGNPTQSLEFLEQDIPAAIASCGEGQAFVASIVGVPPNMEADFCTAAARMRELGAPIFEANFSCPNVTSADGALFQNPNGAGQVARALVKTLGDRPLVIKLGAITDAHLMESLLTELARAGVRGIAAINTLKGEVRTPDGKPALGPDRLTSGVCGGPIRSTALEVVRLARDTIDREKLPLTLIGVGGITAPEHFDDFFNAGADFAHVATGMMWDPYLGERYHAKARQPDLATTRR